jgi:uncharacterized protein YdaU (DUF1376 family)
MSGADVLDLADDCAVGFTFFKMHLLDWDEGTVGFDLELEGGYGRFLNRLYKRGKPLPDDDRFMSTLMRLSLRVWKRIKAELITMNKIVVRNGCLTNPRFERERAERAATIRRQSEAAIEMHARRRTADSQPDESGKFEQRLAETSRKLSGKKSKKSNEINDTGLLDHVPIRSKSLEEEESSLRSDSPPAEAVEDLTPERRIWGRCAEWLARKTGKPDKQVKALIGKWLKIVTHVELLEHFQACRDSEADPIPYLTAIVMRAEKSLMERCRRGGRDLQRSLDRINGNIPQHIVGTNLEAKVRSEIIKLVDIEQSWDRRSSERAGDRGLTGAAGRRKMYEGVL